MTEDKPLHVRVAEAMGCAIRFNQECGCPGAAHSSNWLDTNYKIDRYDTDWSATGPLIEKYRLCLYWQREINGERIGWVAIPDTETGYAEPRGFGVTPLIAVCNLILALAEAGKLPQ